MRRNPAGYVWKFLLDQSYVLQSMCRHFGWIHNDVKLRNVLIAGDARNYKACSFVAIDYGLSLSVDAARRQLSSAAGRARGLCNQGTCASPIDVRVLYGVKRPVFCDDDEAKRERYILLQHACLRVCHTLS